MSITGFSKSDPDRLEYEHPQFKRDLPLLLNQTWIVPPMQIHSKMVQKSADRLTLLDSRASQLQAGIDADVAMGEVLAEFLADIRELDMGLEKEESQLMQDQVITQANLAGLTQRKERCEVQRRATQAMMEKHHAFL